MSFIAELKRRKVIRVGIAYVIGAWLVLQLTEVLSELLNLPEKVGPVVVALVVIGLPIALFLSWAYELTSEGLVRESNVEPGQRSSGKFINLLVIGLLAVALAYFVWESRFQDAGGEPEAASAPLVEEATGNEAVSVPRSIAVLPFENFSTEKADEYFADGLTDTLLHKLAQIQELKVIARNSTFQFKGTNKDVREIGEILGVETVLEGSVQRAGDQVRVIAQLVQTSDGAHLWSETFDDTMENIFALQDRIATSIVDQFELELSQAEQARLLRNGTDVPEAYDLLIRALNQPFRRDEMVDTDEQESEPIALLKQAIELDPDYAQAWAQLSRKYNGLAFATDSAEAHERYVEHSLAAAEEALRLNPDIPQSHSAMGWVMHRKYEKLKAAQSFRRALELDPNHTDALSGLALQLGLSDPSEALSLLERSLEIDPTSAIVYRQKHFAQLTLGQFDDAVESLKKAIEIDPTEGVYYNDLADLMEWAGRPDEGARYASQLLKLSPGSYSGQMALAEAWIAALEPGRAGQWLTLILQSRDGSDETKRLNTEHLVAAALFDEAMEQIDNTQVGENQLNRLIRLRLSACMGLRQGECTIQQAGRLKAERENAALRGSGVPELDLVWMLGLILGGELDDPQFNSYEAVPRLMSMAENSRFFGPAFYLKAGLAARAGNLEGGFEHLELALAQPNGAVFNVDAYGLSVEHSLLLSPFKGDPAFDQWMQRYRAQRDAMLARMIEMEIRGEIIQPSMVERMATQ